MGGARGLERQKLALSEGLGLRPQSRRVGAAKCGLSIPNNKEAKFIIFFFFLFIPLLTNFVNVKTAYSYES
jgi:hypothetical protein